MTDTTAGEGVKVYGDERDEMLAALREKCPNLYALPECPPDDLLKAGEGSRADEAIRREFDRAKALAAQPSAGAQGEVVAWRYKYHGDTEPTWGLSDDVSGLNPERYEIQPLYATPAQPDTGDVEALREDGPFVAGLVWQETDITDEDGNIIWTSEVQTAGGWSVIATVHGATEDEAKQRRDACLAALSKPNAPGRE